MNEALSDSGSACLTPAHKSTASRLRPTGQVKAVYASVASVLKAGAAASVALAAISASAHFRCVVSSLARVSWAHQALGASATAWALALAISAWTATEFPWTCLLYTSPSPRDRQK